MDRLSTKGQMIDQIDLSAVPHSGFDRSNHNYFSGKLGAIIPTRLDEVYPGDRIKGTPKMVANFEPLVAPLMGSMVLKQESFFVPLPQLWRHSYKFFTGKNGFNEKMPSISPYKLFSVLNNTLLGEIIYSIGGSSASDVSTSTGFDFIVNVLSQLRNGFTVSDNQTFSDIAGANLYITLEQLIESTIYSKFDEVYGSRKMFDLVEPLMKHLRTWYKSSEIGMLSALLENTDASFASREKAILEFSGSLGSILFDIHQFWFGPSTVLDYMGWPITTPDNLKAFTAVPEYGVENIFQEAVYRNIFIYSSFDLEAVVVDLFSKIPLNFLPLKAYYLCWYWNYRDQLLETGILDPEEDEFLGSNITDNVIIYCTLMRQRCWFKDAYTTALTNTGDGNLLVPTDTGDAQISYEFYDAGGKLIETKDAGDAIAAGATICKVFGAQFNYSVPMNYFGSMISDYSSQYPTERKDQVGYLSLDLFDRIKRLRSVVQKRLILGYEVDDVVYSSFMVRMSNVRIHIPEILGRGRDAVQISTIVNNTSTDQQIAGDKTATAWVEGTMSEHNYFSEEWGYYLQFATIMPIQSYAGGIQRLYLKQDPFDFMWPEYATMGMDAIYNCELAAFGSQLSDDNGMKVFGYQGRYYDLKYRQDEEHGRLRTDLNYLTFSREFNNDNLPKLNYMFVHCWPRLDGFVVEDELEDLFRADCYTAQGWERRLPVPSEFVH